MYLFLFRTFYTQRILSIVANVKKQNEEMHRVLEDVKSVQREINSIQGKVERTFTVTDEIIFRVSITTIKMLILLIKKCCYLFLFLLDGQIGWDCPAYLQVFDFIANWLLWHPKISERIWQLVTRDKGFRRSSMFR